MLSYRRFYTQGIAIRGPVIPPSIVKDFVVRVRRKAEAAALISHSRRNLLRPLVEKGLTWCERHAPDGRPLGQNGNATENRSITSRVASKAKGRCI
jgi:hypothetical protein